jgi:hypothetical protein
MYVGKSNFEYLKMLQCFMSQILIKFSQPEYNIISYHIIAKTYTGNMFEIDSTKTKH